MLVLLGFRILMPYIEIMLQDIRFSNKNNYSRTIGLNLFLVTIFLFSCIPAEDKINRAYKECVIEDYNFQDSLIRYNIYKDSLVFQFIKNSKIKYWSFEIIIDDTLTQTNDHDLVLNKKTYEVTDSRLILKGIKIKNPEHSVLYVFTNPMGENGLAFVNGEIMNTIKYMPDSRETLKTIDYWKWRKFKLQIIDYHKLSKYPNKIKKAVEAKFVKRVIQD